MGCLKCYTAIEEFIGSKFESYAGFLCKHPWYFIFIPILVNGLLGIGLVNLKSDNDVERVYTPRNSEAVKDRESLRSLFGDASGSTFYTQSQIESGLYGDIIFQTKQGENILNNRIIDEIKNVYEFTKSFKINDHSGLPTNYSTMCALRGTNCVVDGDIIFSTWFQNHLQSNTIPYPGSGAQSLKGIFGNIRVSTSGILTNATMIKFRFHLKHDTENGIANAEIWMDEFLNKMQNLQTNYTTICYAHSKSLDDELNANIGGDILYFSLTFTLMIVYATTVTTNGKCLTDRQNLGRAGVLAAALAILGSFGIVSACGLEFVSIVGTMPFLIIGIGVDDMFLLLSGLADTYDCKSKTPLEPSDRIKKTMRSSGVGITITSLTDLLAFLIGASSKFNSVRNFCVYTGTAVLFCYFNYITFFLACMAIHEERVYKRKHCCTCQDIEIDNRDLDNILQNQPHRCLCTGKEPASRSDVEGPFEKYPPRIIAKFVLLTPVKFAVICFFGVYLGISIWGATQFQQGLILNNLVADDSYYFKYSQINEQYFPLNFAVSLTIPTTLKYSDDKTWDKINRLETLIQQVTGIDKTSSLNWLSAFRNSVFYDNSSETNFITALRSQFLPSMPHFKNDIKFGPSNTTIVASRVYVFSENVTDSHDQGVLMKHLRDVALSSPLRSTIVYAPVFIFFEQYVAILPSTLQTLGIAIAAIFVITAIFLPHPVLVLLVTLTLAMIMVGLFGFMHFWGLTLSSITMIHIIMSVGFSVDFSAHICHGYMESAESDRNDGAKGALIRSGGPIYNGAISSVVGIIMLLFSKSFIFKSFFKVMLLIIILGAAHSLFFLPVILSLVGPKFKTKDKKVPSQDIKNNNAQKQQESKFQFKQVSSTSGNVKHNAKDKQYGQNNDNKEKKTTQRHHPNNVVSTKSHNESNRNPEKEQNVNKGHTQRNKSASSEDSKGNLNSKQTNANINTKTQKSYDHADRQNSKTQRRQSSPMTTNGNLSEYNETQTITNERDPSHRCQSTEYDTKTPDPKKKENNTQSGQVRSITEIPSENQYAYDNPHMTHDIEEDALAQSKNKTPEKGQFSSPSRWQFTKDGFNTGNSDKQNEIIEMGIKSSHI